MLRDKSSLIDILNACESIERYIKNKVFNDFDKDEMMQDAVIRKIEILGEASNRISEETKTRFPDLPWDKMKGMRNILIHMYDELDLNIIWDTVTKDIPPLKTRLSKLLPSIKE
jgi:uncharacterized protein with HEPN domain